MGSGRRSALRYIATGSAVPRLLLPGSPVACPRSMRRALRCPGSPEKRACTARRRLHTRTHPHIALIHEHLGENLGVVKSCEGNAAHGGRDEQPVAVCPRVEDAVFRIHRRPGAVVLSTWPVSTNQVPSVQRILTDTGARELRGGWHNRSGKPVRLSGEQAGQIGRHGPSLRSTHRTPPPGGSRNPAPGAQRRREWYRSPAAGEDGPGLARNGVRLPVNCSRAAPSALWSRCPERRTRSGRRRVELRPTAASRPPGRHLRQRTPSSRRPSVVPREP